MSEYYKKASFIKRMSQLAKQERLAREKKEAEQKKVVKESSSYYEDAEDHKSAAERAKAKGDMGAYHHNMANHHESLGHWHEAKGRNSAADKEYAKAEEHHEHSLKHPYQESVSIQESDEIESSDYKLSPTGRKVRAKHIIFRSQDDDENQDEQTEKEQKEKMKNEEYELDEKTMTDAEMKKREEIVKSMKKKVQGFKARYGDRAKEVMYATATKMAMKEEAIEEAVKVHRIAVTMSDPDHTMVSKRKETVQKFVRVPAKSEDLAIKLGKRHFNRQGYKIHSAEHVGMVQEATTYSNRAVRPAPKTDIKVGDRVVADLRKEKNYPNKQQYCSGTVDRVGEKGVHIKPDRGGESEWHPYKIVKKLGAKSVAESLELQEANKYDKIWARQSTSGGSYQVHGKTSDGTVKTLHTGLNRIEAEDKAKKLTAKHNIQEATQYVVKYHTAKGEHKNTSKAFDSKEKAQSHASRGNVIDKVGGKYTVHAITEGVEMLEAKEPPFEGGVPAKGTVKDKSGAVHSPMSRARDLARQAMKKQVKEGYDLDITDEQADDLIAESFLDTVEQLVEHDAEFAKKHGFDFRRKTYGAEMKHPSKGSVDINRYGEWHHSKGGKVVAQGQDQSSLGKHLSTMKESLDDEGNLEEAMISYSDFHAKIAAHRKAGNDIADSHYGEKKAHYTVVDKEGTARKVTHTEKGSKMENLGAHKGEVEDESGQKVQKTVHEPAVKRGRGRPSGQTGLSYKPRDPASKAASAAKAAASKAANRAKKTK